MNNMLRLPLLPTPPSRHRQKQDCQRANFGLRLADPKSQPERPNEVYALLFAIKQTSVDSGRTWESTLRLSPDAPAGSIRQRTQIAVNAKPKNSDGEAIGVDVRARARPASLRRAFRTSPSCKHLRSREKINLPPFDGRMSGMRVIRRASSRRYE
jgi:hypothetical protein